jgi:hypothetical protein
MPPIPNQRGSGVRNEPHGRTTNQPDVGRGDPEIDLWFTGRKRTETALTVP